LNLNQKIYKLRKTSINILIKKLIEKQSSAKENKLQRSNDLVKSTYSSENAKLNLCFLSFDIDNIDGKQFAIFKEIADNALSHKFKLLSDKYIHISHQNKYEGFEGNNYSKQSEQFKFKNGVKSWLATSFALGNRDYVKELSNLLPANYSNIDWQVDFKSGFRWNELDWSKDIKYGDKTGADIKVPWELGRLQHFPIMLIVAKIEQRNDLVQEIENQFIDFYLSNPPRFGNQWMTSMDVSIRLVNLLYTIELAELYDIKLSSNIIELLNKSILDHYHHIWNNLEFSSGFRGNHYLINICSLLVVTIYLYEAYGNRLKDIIDLIETELAHQFYKDGGNFENSTCYHKLVSEMLILAFNILDKSQLIHKLSFSKEAKIKFSFIMQFLDNIQDRQGKLPQIGDNDSGYILRTNYGESLKNINYLLHKDKSDPVEFATFADFGLTRYSNENYDLFIKHSPALGNMGKGGHDHNDALSFTLSNKSSEIFVNQGTYCYTADRNLRNHYRSTEAHNVLYINGVEQNEFYSASKDDLFWVAKQKAIPKVISVNHISFIGEIDYGKSTYRRTYFVKNDSLIVKESYSSNIEKELHFHLNKGCYVKYLNENSILIITQYDEKIRFTFDNGELEIKDYWLSPEYGVKIKAYKLIIKFKQEELNWYLDFTEKNEY